MKDKGHRLPSHRPCRNTEYENEWEWSKDDSELGLSAEGMSDRSMRLFEAS